MEADENRYEGMLSGKTVVVAVTASISLYRIPDLVRELRREGARVIVGMSQEASRLISPTIFNWASENPVVTEISGNIEHISLFIGHTRDTSLLICPASYNSIGKISNGISDDIPSLFFSFAMGNGNPIDICPAMHEGMMINPINQENLEKLKGLGVGIIPPRMLEQKAKISENDLAVDYVCRSLGGRPLRGKRILVIGGRGEEKIDPVRSISNSGSGLTFSWFGINAFRLGADRIVMIGNTDFRIPDYADYRKCINIEDFEAEVLKALSKEKFDMVINCASLPDFKVSNRSDTKLPGNRRILLELEPRHKLLETVRRHHSGTLIAFKLDHEMGAEEIRKKLEASSPDAIVYNVIDGISSPFGEVRNHYRIITPRETIDLGSLPKPQMTLKVLLSFASGGKE